MKLKKIVDSNQGYHFTWKNMEFDNLFKKKKTAETWNFEQKI